MALGLRHVVHVLDLLHDVAVFVPNRLEALPLSFDVYDLSFLLSVRVPVEPHAVECAELEGDLPGFASVREPRSPGAVLLAVNIVPFLPGLPAGVPRAARPMPDTIDESRLSLLLPILPKVGHQAVFDKRSLRIDPPFGSPGDRSSIVEVLLANLEPGHRFAGRVLAIIGAYIAASRRRASDKTQTAKHQSQLEAPVSHDQYPFQWRTAGQRDARPGILFHACISTYRFGINRADTIESPWAASSYPVSRTLRRYPARPAAIQLRNSRRTSSASVAPPCRAGRLCPGSKSPSKPRTARELDGTGRDRRLCRHYCRRGLFSCPSRSADPPTGRPCPRTAGPGDRLRRHSGGCGRVPRSSVSVRWADWLSVTVTVTGPGLFSYRVVNTSREP